MTRFCARLAEPEDFLKIEPRPEQLEETMALREADGHWWRAACLASPDRIAFEWEGKVVALGGLVFDPPAGILRGWAIIGAKITWAAMANVLDFTRTWLSLFPDVAIYATTRQGFDAAGRTLAHLGFKPLGASRDFEGYDAWVFDPNKQGEAL